MRIRRLWRSLLTHRVTRHSMAMNERGNAQGPSRSAVARRCAGASDARLRDRGNVACPQRRRVRLARRHALSGAAPVRARRTAIESVVRGQRSPSAGLPAHTSGSPRACQAARGVARLRTGGSRSGGGARMTSAALEAYLSRLQREFWKRGLQDRRIVDEAREHLFDAVEDGLQRGLSVDAARSEGLVRFGPPETVAVDFAPKWSRMSSWLF